MNKEYSIIVDLGKKDQKNNNFSQILYCKCGHKQNSKITIKRTLLRNTENLFEDKHSIENIICSSCKTKYDVLNNLYGLKANQKVLVEVKYEREEIKLKNNSLKILKKKKRFFYYDGSNNELKEFTLIDLIIFDKLNKKVKLYVDESLLNNDIFNEEDNNLLKYNSKNTKLDVFDLTNIKFSSKFFEFDESVHYKNLDQCFFYFEDLICETYDCEALKQDKFVSNFKISSEIILEEKNGVIEKYVFQKDLFDGKNLIKRKLNTGDYLNKLTKFCDVSCLFIVFPNVSSLFKTKSLDFVYNAFRKQFFCSESILNYHNASSPAKILEICCKNLYQEKNNLKEFSKDDFYGNDESFKISPILYKNIKESDDVLVLYKFAIKNLISKQDIENLFQNYDSEDVLKIMAKIVSGVNLRDVKLNMKHIKHIIKCKFYEQDKDEWLSLYYDTINTLNLIVKLVENKEFKEKNKKMKGLDSISDNKLFEIKNFKKLKEVHDEMFAIYRALEDDSKDLIYRTVVKAYKNLNSKLNLFNFTVIPNLKDLSKEGLVMKHCIYTYLNDITKGNYLAINIKDTISKERATMGLKIVNGKLHLQQLKGYENSRPTALLINTALEFCNKNEIVIQSNNLHQSDITPNESLEKRMKEYLDKKTAFELRTKKLNK